MLLYIYLTGCLASLLWLLIEYKKVREAIKPYNAVEAILAVIIFIALSWIPIITELCTKAIKQGKRMH